MADDKKIYMIPDVEIIDSKVDVAGIPYDVVLISLIITIALVFISGSMPILRIFSIPLGVLSGFSYYHLISKRDKNFYRQISYYLTIKRVKGMPISTDKVFTE